MINVRISKPEPAILMFSSLLPGDFFQVEDDPTSMVFMAIKDERPNLFTMMALDIHEFKIHLISGRTPVIPLSVKCNIEATRENYTGSSTSFSISNGRELKC